MDDAQFDLKTPPTSRVPKVEEELEKYHRILVDDELRSLRKDMTFQLWQMEKEAAEWKKTKSTEEDFEHREHLDVLEIGR